MNRNSTPVRPSFTSSAAKSCVFEMSEFLAFIEESFSAIDEHHPNRAIYFAIQSICENFAAHMARTD